MSMRFAYLIAAHDKPQQLMLLLDTLLQHDNDDYVVLHLDAKSSLWKHSRRQFAEHSSGRVHVIDKPASVYWGDPSLVDAIHLLLDRALAIGFDMCHHISGVDWPTATRVQIEQDISAIGPLRPIHSHIMGEKDSHRMQNYWLRDRFRGKFTGEFTKYHVGRLHVKLLRGFNSLNHKLVGERSTPFGPWIKASQWWSMPYDASVFVSKKLHEHSKRIKQTSCPDEHVIQTILYSNFPDRIQPYRRFILWQQDAWNPETLTADHIPAIKESGAWFARKVDMAVDNAVISAFADY